LTACGGAKHTAPPPPPAFAHSLGSSLAAQSDGVAAALAAGDSCRASTLARRLQQQTIAAINQHRVAPALEEQLSSAVNALVVRVKCVPPPAVTPATTPAPRKHEHPHDHGKHKGRDKKKHEEKD
jgi:hypothetical protein